MLLFDLTDTKTFPISLSEETEKQAFKESRKSGVVQVFKKANHTPITKEFLDLVSFWRLISQLLFDVGLYCFIFG